MMTEPVALQDGNRLPTRSLLCYAEEGRSEEGSPRRAMCIRLACAPESGLARLIIVSVGEVQGRHGLSCPSGLSEEASERRHCGRW